MPSETIYIAGLAVFVAGLLCAVGGAMILGVTGTLAGGILWALAWRSRSAELRNYRAFYSSDPKDSVRA